MRRSASSSSSKCRTSRSCAMNGPIGCPSFSSTVSRFSSGLTRSINLYAKIRSGQSARSVSSVVTIAAQYHPAPHAMPIAATTHSVAAGVSPRTDSPSRMIAPAPRKPMPVTICAAMRVGSARTTLAPLVRNEWNAYAETIVNNADPSETSRCVRIPASRSRSSRSIPIAPPSPAATARRSTMCASFSDGMALAARNRNRVFLVALQVLDAGRGEIEQVVEPRAIERHLLGGRLHLDEAPVVRHDDVDVDVGDRVPGVVEVEQRDAVDDADRHGGHAADERLREAEPVERALRRGVCAGDGRAARAAVRLQHVAVEVDRALAEGREVDDAAQGAADQPLDLDGPPTLFAARGL